jgi:uncharacterized protein (DUF1697 family)
MERLRGLFEELGLQGVETFIASGNVSFDGRKWNEAGLRKLIERHLQESLGYEVVTFLRTDRELQNLVKGCPFSEGEVAGARALNVALLQAPLTAEAMARLQTLRTGVDAFRAKGR